MMNVLLDIKYAMRMLLNRPKFTALAVLIMATGLGLSVYMIAFLSNTIYKDLDFENGDEIYALENRTNGDPTTDNGEFNLLDYLAIKESNRSFSHVGGYRVTRATISNTDGSLRKFGTYITTDIFSFLKVNAQLGRTFTEQDLALNAASVAIISHNMWVSDYQQDKNILGKTLKVDGIVTEIVGVMSPDKVFPVGTEIWLPSTDNALHTTRTDTNYVQLYLRKLPTVTVEQANADVKGIMGRLAEEFPETNTGLSAQLITIQKRWFGGSSSAIVTAMLAAVMLVLALACINVANLLLARANERSKETAIRLALGAPRMRLVMQMMWESIIICFVAGVVGLLCAAYALEILNVLLDTIFRGFVPFWWKSEVDSTLLIQSFVLIIFTALIAGAFPAWKMTQCNVNSELRDGTRGAVGKKAGRLNKILVVIEVALSCILLVVAGVLYMVIEDTKNVDFGAKIDNKIQVSISLPLDTYKEDSQKIQYFQRVLNELNTIEGATQVGSMSILPGNFTRLKKFQPESYEVVDHKYPEANQVVSFANSIETMGISLLEGRHFNNQDTMDSMPVVIVTESLANKYWPNDSAIGKRFKFKNGNDNKSDKWMNIIGIVKHVSFDNGTGDRKNYGAIFHPYTQKTRHNMSNFIAVTGNTENKLAEISIAVAKVDPLVPTFDVYSLTENIRRSFSGLNFIRDLFSVFALCALLLAATGIYGVLSSTTYRRTQELGIRRALGATDNNVIIMLIKQGWMQLTIGLIIGLPVGFMISQGFVNNLVPITNSYYYVYVVVPIMIALVVLFSTFFPAKKATALEPSSALRYE